MATPPTEAPSEASLKEAQEAVTRQGDAVRALKASIKEGKAEKVRNQLLYATLKHHALACTVVVHAMLLGQLMVGGMRYNCAHACCCVAGGGGGRHPEAEGSEDCCRETAEGAC